MSQRIKETRSSDLKIDIEKMYIFLIIFFRKKFKNIFSYKYKISFFLGKIHL